VKRIKILGLALTAVLSLIALATTSASAAAGPLYLIEGRLLNTGEHAKVEVSNLGAFVLTTQDGINVVCTSLSAPTLLIGGTPGRSETEIHYTGCTGEGRSECDVNSSGAKGGLILVDAEDELVYSGTKEQAEKELPPLGDLFRPAGGGTSFVTLSTEALKTGACSATLASVEVKGNTVGLIEPVNTDVLLGMLTFDKSPIKEAWLWLGDGVTPDKVKVGLTVSGLPAIQLGLADVKLTTNEKWGVQTGLNR
jgi:hypothetical protein